MSHIPRQRLGSVGDSAPPSSDSSEGSETCEVVPDWSLGLDNDHHNMLRHSIHQQQQQQLKQQQLHLQQHLMPLDIVHHHVQEHPNGLFINTDTDLRHDSLSLENSGAITESERVQIESFFSGLGTEVFVSLSLANLYESVAKDDWRLMYTGIPVLLHDKGSARARSTPRVTFVLAERGSCFALWKDTIDNLSDYRVAGSAFHTMCLSSDHRKVIGFSFDSSQAARDIWCCIEKLISDPENIALSVPGRKRKTNKRNKPLPLPQKSQISHPCQFHHVTSVTTDDTQRYFSLQAFVTPPPGRHRDH